MAAAPSRSALRSLLWPTLVTLIALVILIGLGNWQVRRLAWKESLIAAAESRSVAEAVPAPGPDAWPALDMDDWIYQRVEATGRYGDDEIHVFMALPDPNGPLGGQGYLVFAPFTTTDGWTLLVDRGFVPLDRKDPETRPGPPEGEVRIEGLMRPGEMPAFFSPDPDLDKNVWLVRELGAMAEALGMRRTAPYYVSLVASETPEGGVPQAGETPLTFANSHLQYAVTWYGLAVVLVFVYGTFAWRRLRD
ncbi:SURF1 family protein [Amorphus orientalis]|uniref:SURF1-like protein n=1 Tax=Amorphus orientalis TaxID=649198 RepID=A0AAE4ATU6_9HYPH|nr:SURF1 family protein [Amorphus orientalis]MDQ0316708.1 surfeit locus 1 family protein [Amorphus orientalis]